MSVNDLVISRINVLERDIAATLRLIFMKGYSAEKNTLLEGPLQRVIQGIEAAYGKGLRLEAATIFLLLPILEYVFSQPTLLKGCESAFLILDYCWPDPEDDVRIASVRQRQDLMSPLQLQTLRPLLKVFILVCLHVMAKFRLEPSPDHVIIRITSSVVLERDEWQIMVSDHGMLSKLRHVRYCCLKVVADAIQHSRLKSNHLLESTVLLASQFEEKDIRDLAGECLQLLVKEILPIHIELLFDMLKHSEEHVREASGRAIGAGLAKMMDENYRIQTLKLLVETYDSRRVPKVKGEEFKMQRKKNIIMNKKNETDLEWHIRKAIALALEEICIHAVFGASSGRVEFILSFILMRGVVDNHQDVRESMLRVGLALINSYGDIMSNYIYGFIDDVLNGKVNDDLEDLDTLDQRHEASVILMGAIGGHLNKEDPHILRITASLMEALNTPSERVQRAVADCLSPIVTVLKSHEKAPDFLESLMNRITNAETYGERRGAAFGLSAVVKGLGIACLKQYNIVERLKLLCSESHVNAREGSLFAFECLSERLGLLFEPYVIPIIPILLKCFSHSSDHVRDAAHMAAKAIMSKLSAHGVKQVLNPILASLPDEKQWKSRQESIRLLGSMAHLSPKSLATSLPQIIPRLVEAGSDPHPKVKESARSALNDISSVIKNPEIAELSPILLQAIGDPALKTKSALEALLSCEFMHSIDAPSLAVLIPILSRALKDRSADLKRKSAAIIGNITGMLVETKIIAPYLSQIIPGLKISLVDPIPDVRTMAAKALGSLVGGVGEDECVELIPWLMDTLKSEESPVERSGAAQGLAEVALVLGNNRLKTILNEALVYKGSSKSYAREGLLWLLSFLPAVLKESFAEHIATTLPVVLVGLSDMSDSVREVALRAGHTMVQQMGRRHALQLLPSLQGGIFDEDSLIRQSSVALLGELLYMIADVKAVGVARDDDEDEGGLGAMTNVLTSIRATLGSNNTDVLLASLYIVRSDTAPGVRQTSLQVWKSIVSNTPRTLVEIMSTLVDVIVQNLSNDDYELNAMASRCLGDVVKKLGSKVLAVLVPCLQRGLEHGDKYCRQGVCLGIAEILNALTRQQVETYLGGVIISLQTALCDVDESVRNHAASAFQALVKTMGPAAIDEVVPALVNRLEFENEEGERALLGLREVVQLKPKDLLEYLLPRLLKSPIERASAIALATVAKVTGQHLHYHFQLIVNQLTTELSLISPDDDRFVFLKQSASDVMGATSSTGVNLLLIELGKQIENEFDSSKRRWGCWLLEQFLLNTSAKFSEYIGVLLKYLLSRVADKDAEVLSAVLGALSALNKVYPVEDYIREIDFISSCISSTASDARFRNTAGIQTSKKDYVLPLFTIQKSLDAFLPMLLFALTGGNAQQRESAACVIGEFVLMCDENVLKPSLIKITGPLIRVVGDRFPSSVKASILDTLLILLERGGVALKAFAPQLQTTFVKSLNDPSKQVRVGATAALNRLISLNLTARVDPLLVELSTAVAQAESSAVKSSIIDALSNVLKHCGRSASSTVLLEKIEPLVLLNLEDREEEVRNASVACLHFSAPSLDANHMFAVAERILSKKSDEPHIIIGKLLGGASIVRYLDQTDHPLVPQYFSFLKASFANENPTVRIAACRLSFCFDFEFNTL